MDGWYGRDVCDSNSGLALYSVPDVDTQVNKTVQRLVSSDSWYPGQAWRSHIGMADELYDFYHVTQALLERGHF